MVLKSAYKRIAILFVGILVVIFITSFLFQKFTRGVTFSEYLGFVFGTRCMTTLTLRKTEPCLIKARILANNCYGSRYEIREDSCSGEVKCEGNIDFNYFQANCVWNEREGSGLHTYVLCIDGKRSFTALINC